MKTTSAVAQHKLRIQNLLWTENERMNEQTEQVTFRALGPQLRLWMINELKEKQG